MKQVRKGGGGRPRQFDRDRALDVAMRLFWRDGYEGVGVADLTAAMGIAAPSLYAAFGCKADLYRAAVERYAKDVRPADFAIFETPFELAEAVREFLSDAVAAITDPAGLPGCLVSCGMVTCAPAHAALAREVASRREALRDTLAAKLERWMAPPDAVATARHLCAVMQGLSIQARDGATARQLNEVVDEVADGLAARFPETTRYGRRLT